MNKIFNESHRENDTREKLFSYLENLRIRNSEQLSQFKNNLKLEICEMLKIWLENSKILNKTTIKLYRVKDRLKDLISFYKNCHDRSVTPSENYYLKSYVKRVQEKLNTNMIAVPMTQAPILTFSDGLRLASNMWDIGSERSKFTSKLSALVLKLTLYTGGRTGDFLKLRWRDIKISKAFNGDKALSLFCITKTNAERKLPGRKDIFCPLKDPNNPLLWLLQLAKLRKPSKEDFVFRLKNNKLLTTDLFVYHMSRAAERINLKFYPKGHSARNGVIATLSLSGVSKNFLRIACEWKPSSDMPQTYIRNNLGLSEMGAAFKIRELISSEKISSLQKQITNTFE